MTNHSPRRLFSRRIIAAAMAVGLAISGAGVNTPAQALNTNKLAPDVRYVTQIVSYGALCTGTLISPTWVLTARHCVRQGDDVKGTVGFGNRAQGKMGFTGAYHYGKWDVALIHLNKPAPNPFLPLSLSPAREGQTGTLYGWGKGRFPMRMSSAKVIGHYTAQYGKMFVTSTRQGGQEPGDSGGPFIHHGALVGVLSSVGAPQGGVVKANYVEVSHLWPWVISTMLAHPRIAVAS